MRGFDTSPKNVYKMRFGHLSVKQELRKLAHSRFDKRHDD